MKKIYFPISFLLLLFYLCSCNSSNTGTTTQNEANTVPEVKAVFINGDSIHYIDIGKGDPVVFVHGAVGDYRTWKTQMDEFSQNHRVIAYSRRFAYPNKQMINDSADLTVTAHAKDLSDFVKALNLGPVHLVGHSFGGCTALLTAIDHPELIRSLTLCEPFVPSLLQNVPGGDTILNNFISKAFTPVAEAFKNSDNEKAVKALVTGVMGDSLYFSRLSQEHRENMMVNIPELKVATLTNTTHGLEYENPVEFNKVVLGFIDKN